MSVQTCPFCQISNERVLWQSEQTMALYDQYPVSPGHMLLITKRHVPSYFDATPEEQSALWDSLQALKAIAEQQHKPSGYHVGFNAGEAAGQTVMHLHVHFIPKYHEDGAHSISEIIQAPKKRQRDTSPETLQVQATQALARFFEAKPKSETTTERAVPAP